MGVNSRSRRNENSNLEPINANTIGFKSLTNPGINANTGERAVCLIPGLGLRA